MTTVLSDPRPAPAAPAPGGLSRNVFPIGARFPRRSDRTAPSVTGVAVTAPGPIFPVGARFPRRSAVDELIYLEAAFANAAPPARTTHPVGARFPRRLR